MSLYASNEAALQARLDRAHRELQEFASIVSHDLRAPLRGMRSLLTWIEEDDPGLSETTRAHLEGVKQQVAKMDGLVEALLRYTRMGRADVEVQEVSAQAAAEHALAGLAVPPEVQVEIEGPLPVVRFNDVQLEHVFRALIDNAVRYLGKPGRVRVYHTAEADADEFHVEDDGPGIEARHHERIFGLFQSLNPEEDAIGGVGLALVKKVVEQRGGTVRMVSSPGAGSTFSIRVPRMTSRGEAEEAGLKRSNR